MSLLFSIYKRYFLFIIISIKKFNSALLFMPYVINDSKWLVQDLQKVKYAILRPKGCPKF